MSKQRFTSVWDAIEDTPVGADADLSHMPIGD
jgi:predicted XRE-type DNA-binding protein